MAFHYVRGEGRRTRLIGVRGGFMDPDLPGRLWAGGPESEAVWKHVARSGSLAAYPKHLRGGLLKRPTQLGVRTLQMSLKILFNYTAPIRSPQSLSSPCPVPAA